MIGNARAGVNIALSTNGVHAFGLDAGTRAEDRRLVFGALLCCVTCKRDRGRDASADRG
jgi:hypothetical protein